jgi:phosphoribosylformimino-5-aminoimidazole carboxamide ribotide isomerase
MLVIPVIDIKNGKCVRVVEGLEDKTIYYSESPLTMAKLFRKENAKILHITDLDGAYSGTMSNYELIKDISASIGIPVQLGGGIRTYDIASRLLNESGVYRIVITSLAIDNPDEVISLLKQFGPRRLVIGIDIRDDFMVRDGWLKNTNLNPTDFAHKMKKIGVERIIFQDVTRVGEQLGPNIEATKKIALKTGLKVTAAGGIGSYEDLKKISELEIYGVDSVMISRALYENKFPCQAIWREIEKTDTSLELPEVY